MDIQQFSDRELIEEMTRRSWKVGDIPASLYQKQEEELKLLSVRLREAERGKSDFLSNVRNEINNPLTSILGLTARMAQMAKDEHLTRISRLVHQEVFELDYQIRNIITASEVELGELRLLPALADISTLIQAQFDYLQPRTAANNINIQFMNGLANGFLFSTDPAMFQIIMVNLLANAIEFSEKNSSVYVNVSAGQNKLVVVVQDFGLGIEPELQKRIFERFNQLDQGPRKQHRGQGLGLAIVGELVLLMKGTINIDSQPKAGTMITVELPYLESESSVSDSAAFGNDILFDEGEEF